MYRLELPNRFGSLQDARGPAFFPPYSLEHTFSTTSRVSQCRLKVLISWAIRTRKFCTLYGKAKELAPRVSKGRKRSENLVPSKWYTRQRREAAPGLTRERIVDAAMRISDLRGLDAVSMGNVASKLDSSTMALYYYVPSERDLLNLRRLKRRPWIGALRTPDREYGPGCIWSLESFLTRSSQRGLGVQAAIRMLSALSVFVNGIVANEIVDREGAQSRSRNPPGTQPVEFSAAALASGEFSYVTSFRPPTVLGLPATLASDRAGRSPQPDLRETGRAKRRSKRPRGSGTRRPIREIGD